MIYSFIVCFLIFLASCSSRCADADDFFVQDEAQRPFLIWGTGPLFSLGLNIFPKGTKIASVFPLYTKETHKSSNCLLLNTLYYGVTDRCSLLFDVPVILKEKKLLPHKSQGLGNIVLQGEYAFYQKNDSGARTQCTILGNITMPTTNAPGNTDVLNTKAPSYYLSVTTSNATDLWYTYGDIGVYLCSKRHGFKLGNQLWYDLGIGRTLFRTKDLNISTLLEMSGIYQRPPIIDNKLSLTAGGNTLFLGPTIRLYYKKILILAGFQYVISEVKRSDSETKYRIGFSASYYF